MPDSVRVDQWRRQQTLSVAEEPCHYRTGILRGAPFWKRSSSGLTPAILTWPKGKSHSKLARTAGAGIISQIAAATASGCIWHKRSHGKDPMADSSTA